MERMMLSKSIKPISTFFFVLVVSLLLNGCGPQYKIVEDYYPPQSSQGKQCIQSCQTSKNSCQNSCDRKYNYCLRKAQDIAEQELPDLLNQYVHNYDGYIYAYERYQYEYRIYSNEVHRVNDHLNQTKVLCDQGSNDACHLKKELKHRIKSLYAPAKPQKPIRPTLNTVTADHQRSCSKSCGCSDNFKGCYISCGGQINSRKICIDNCDKIK